MTSFKKLGKTLNRDEQKKVMGGNGKVPSLCVTGQQCETDNDCCFAEHCTFIQYGHPKQCY